MNELMIEFNNGYLYYKTDKTNKDDAFKTFLMALEQAGINHDNFPEPIEMELRDKDGVPID